MGFSRFPSGRLRARVDTQEQQLLEQALLVERLHEVLVGAGLERDRSRALALLRAHPAGAGSLHTIRFSPADTHLDLYQFLALIEIHLRRHLAQIERAARRARR